MLMKVGGDNITSQNKLNKLVNLLYPLARIVKFKYNDQGADKYNFAFPLLGASNINKW